MTTRHRPPDEPPRPRRAVPPPSPPSPEREPAAPAPVGPFELDPLFADAISRVISQAISAEMERVRTSLAPPAPAPVASSEPGEGERPSKPSSEPPRSSIRVAARYTGKGIKWGAIASGALSFIASVIVWTARPEYAAPLAQAIKLILNVIAAATGSGPPALEH